MLRKKVPNLNLVKETGQCEYFAGIYFLLCFFTAGTRTSLPCAAHLRCKITYINHFFFTFLSLKAFIKPRFQP